MNNVSGFKVPWRLHSGAEVEKFIKEQLQGTSQNIGYYVCDTDGGVANKSIEVTGFVMPASGGSIKVKMVHRNTAASNVCLVINNDIVNAKPLYYNKTEAGAANTWDDGEVIDLYYDPSGSGKWMANNVAGGTGDAVFDISKYNFGTRYGSLSEALAGNNVPDNRRKGGMRVKYIDQETGKYVEYRLTSNEWNDDPDNWQSGLYIGEDDGLAEIPDFDAASQSVHTIPQVLSYIQKQQARENIGAASSEELAELVSGYSSIIINGDVSNAPDEEDLTSVNVGGTDVIRFKDKNYAPLFHSGLGRKYLRKNIQEVDGVNKNILTQADFNSGNTIYIIQYDYEIVDDMTENTITIPAGCVLKFEGGSVGKGTIRLAKDTVVECAGKCFGDDIHFEGGERIEWNILWFGAKPSEMQTSKYWGRGLDEEDPNTESAQDKEIVNPPEDDIAAIINKMITAGCYNIFIPANNYVWCSTVRCYSNLKLHGDFIVSNVYDTKNIPSFKEQCIRFARGLKSLIDMGYNSWSTEEHARDNNVQCSLEMWGLNFKGLFGNEVAIISGNMWSCDIHDNIIERCGYFVRSFDLEGGIDNEAYNITVDSGDPFIYPNGQHDENFPDGEHNNSWYADRSVKRNNAGIKSSSGLWVCSRIHNNRISAIARACFMCDICDSYIYDNYITGGSPVRVTTDNGAHFKHRFYKVCFFDGYYWNVIGGSSYIRNNYIEYFYYVYNLPSSSAGIVLLSQGNTYDICTSVFAGGKVRSSDEDGHPACMTPRYTGHISSINDTFMRINNYDSESAQSTRYNLIYNEKATKDIANLVDLEEGVTIGTLNPLTKVNGDSVYYTSTSCYSVFKIIPKNLTLVVGSLVEVEYILQGEEIDLSSSEVFNIIGGKPQMFHYGKLNYGKNSIFISALSDITLPSEVKVTNPVIEKYMSEVSYDLDTEGSAFNNSEYRGSSWTLRYVYTIPININKSNVKTVLNARAYPIIGLVDNELIYYDRDITPIDNIFNKPGQLDNLIPNILNNVEILSTDNVGNTFNNTFTFTPKGSIRLLNIEGVKNTRDIGGWPCDNGYVRYGLVFRGGKLANISTIGKSVIYNNLGVRTDIDLTGGDVTISGITSIKQNLSGAVKLINGAAEYDISGFSTEIAAIFDSINSNIAKVNNYYKAIYIHCDEGRDSTGIIIILLLGLLGVSEGDILKEFDISSYYTASTNYFTASKQFISNVKGGSDSFKEAVENYLNGIGVSASTITGLRDNLITVTGSELDVES